MSIKEEIITLTIQKNLRNTTGKVFIQGISLYVYQCHTLTSLQPPFLHGSPSAISFIPPFLLDPVGANIGLSEEARDGVSGIRGVFSKSGLVPLIVGSGDRCLV